MWSVRPGLSCLSHLLTSRCLTAVLCPLPFGSCEASAGRGPGPTAGTWDSADGCGKCGRWCCHSQGPLSLPGLPHEDPAIARHCPRPNDLDLCLRAGTASSAPHLRKQTSGLSPAVPSQGHLPNPEAPPAPWLTLTSPLQEVLLQVQNRSRGCRLFPCPHSLTWSRPLSSPSWATAASSLSPRPPPPHGPSSTHSQREPVNTSVGSRPSLRRAT